MNEHFSSDFLGKLPRGAVMVDFYAPWCGDCRRIEPILKEIESSHQIIKINIDESPENTALAKDFSVRRIPTLIFFKDGVEVGARLIEPKSKDEILRGFEAALGGK